MARPTTAFRPAPGRTARSASAQIGRFSNRKKARKSSVGATATSQTSARKCRPATSTMAATARSAPRKYRPSSPRRPDRARPAAPRRPATQSAAALTPCLPRARSTSDVVLWPGRISTSTHLAASGLDDLVADDLLAGIVAALDQHARLHLRDQVDRRVLLEDRDEIDRLQRRQHFGARALVLHRAPLALQPLHRGIAVQTRRSGGRRRRAPPSAP